MAEIVIDDIGQPLPPNALDQGTTVEFKLSEIVKKLLGRYGRPFTEQDYKDYQQRNQDWYDSLRGSDKKALDEDKEYWEGMKIQGALNEAHERWDKTLKKAESERDFYKEQYHEKFEETRMANKGFSELLDDQLKERKNWNDQMARLHQDNQRLKENVKTVQEAWDKALADNIALAKDVLFNRTLLEEVKEVNDYLQRTLGKEAQETLELSAEVLYYETLLKHRDTEHQKLLARHIAVIDTWEKREEEMKEKYEKRKARHHKLMDEHHDRFMRCTCHMSINPKKTAE